ncbi:hypothetical protein BHE74_00012626, partial [Ensete ventricosum]
IGGVSLQRSIVWIPLERRTFDLLHLLHPDLEYLYTISLAKVARKKGGRPWPNPLQGWLATARPPARATNHSLAIHKGVDSGARKGQEPVGAMLAGRSTAHKDCRLLPVGAVSTLGQST